MLHSRWISTDEGTTQANAKRTQVKVNKGVLAWVWITFPNNCDGLLKMRIYLDEHPILPVEIDKYIVGDDFTFAIPVMVEIKEEPQMITIETWNDDDTYAHGLQVLMLIVDPKWLMPSGAAHGMIGSLRSMFQRPEVTL